jgi:hypothetical protein
MRRRSPLDHYNSPLGVRVGRHVRASFPCARRTRLCAWAPTYRSSHVDFRAWKKAPTRQITSRVEAKSDNREEPMSMQVSTTDFWFLAVSSSVEFLFSHQH